MRSISRIKRAPKALFAKLLFVAMVAVALALPKAQPNLKAIFTHTKPEHVLSEKRISLENRYPGVPSVNTVFKDNMLLNLAYMDGSVRTTKDIDWTKLQKPGTYSVTLDPGQTFAFHDGTLAGYTGINKTTNAHFNSTEGFKSDGYLVGDGVCHLASIMYWTAKDAGLDAYAPVRHDFHLIPEIPREYGVAIFYLPNEQATSNMQNLYIKNNKQKAVTFAFTYDGTNLSVKVIEQS